MLLERVREEGRHGLEHFVAPLAAPLIFLPRLAPPRRVLDGDREPIGSFPFSSSLLPRPVQALDALAEPPLLKEYDLGRERQGRLASHIPREAL